MKFISTSIVLSVIVSVAMAQSGYNVPLGYHLVPNNPNQAPFARLAAPALNPANASPYPYTSSFPAAASPYTASNLAASSPYKSSNVASSSPYTASFPAASSPYKSSNLATSSPYTPSNLATSSPYTAPNPAAASPYTAAISGAGSPYRSETVTTPELSKTEVHDDSGQNAFSYVTANGIKASERTYLKEGKEGYYPVKEGSYEYTSPEGTPVSFGYKADENGFIVKGFPLPFGQEFAPVPAKA